MYTAEIITIGDEILIGQIIDANSAWMAVELNFAGLKVNKMTSVSDKETKICDALRLAEQRSDVILITGGLGPTNDDITKKTLAKYFDCSKMVTHKPTLEFIEARFAKRGIAMNQLNKQQAEVPECCTVIPNKNGTAPGMWFEKNGTIFISMPGVPMEMKKMFPDILNLLKQKMLLPNIFHKTALTFGIPESVLAEKISDWEQALPEEISLAYLPGIETGVKLRLSTISQDDKGYAAINEQFEKLTLILGNDIYGYEPDTLESVIGKLLLKKNATLAIAESCTGGRIANKIISVSGCSAYFKGGVVAYSNETKINLLEVNPSDLQQFGAVNDKIAHQMAEGVRRILKADYAISTTGIAGPTGGTPDKSVGLCWFGIATPQGTKTFSHTFAMDRLGNIAAASSTALNALRKELD